MIYESHVQIHGVQVTQTPKLPGKHPFSCCLLIFLSGEGLLLPALFVPLPHPEMAYLLESKSQEMKQGRPGPSLLILCCPAALGDNCPSVHGDGPDPFSSSNDRELGWMFAGCSPWHFLYMNWPTWHNSRIQFCLPGDAGVHRAHCLLDSSRLRVQAAMILARSYTNIMNGWKWIAGLVYMGGFCLHNNTALPSGELMAVYNPTNNAR